MDNTTYQEAVQKAIKAKTNGKETITSRALPRYPSSAEREFRRITRSYLGVVTRELRDNLPEVMTAYKREMDIGVREDSIFDFFDKVTDVFNRIGARIEKFVKDFDLEGKVQRISDMVHRTSVKEWKRVVKQSLGIDIMEDYYDGEMYGQTRKEWEADNVNTLSNLPSRILSRVKEIIMSGFRSSKNVTEVKKWIQDEYDTLRKRSEAGVADQVSLLNTSLFEMENKDAGVSSYKWRSMRDNIVRESHKEFDGKIFTWDNPPEGWYKTKARGIVYTGRKCHPGEDYGCRCIAVPVFDITTITLPLGVTKNVPTYITYGGGAKEDPVM